MQNFLKIVSIYIVIIFIGCENENNVFKETKSVKQSNSETNTESLNNFVVNHVKLNNKIILLLRSENNFKFNNNIENTLASSSNISEFKQVLSKAGVSKYSELGDLILSQSRYAPDFKENNKDFALLNEETKKRMILDALNKAITDNPLVLLPSAPINTTLGRTCAQQFTVDVNRCNRNINLSGIAVAVACLTGPWSCGAAAFVSAAVGQACLDDASEDYSDCTN